jgi:hypothetical protein
LKAAALALAFLLGACGGDGGAGASPRTDLRVTLWPDGRDGEAVRATLTCDPAGGDHRDLEAACRVLSRHPEAIDPVPGDAICTQIYGGPAEAEVEGVLDGRRVRASFDRRNGCEIARWERLRPLLALD